MCVFLPPSLAGGCKFFVTQAMLEEHFHISPKTAMVAYLLWYLFILDYVDAEEAFLKFCAVSRRRPTTE